MQALILDAGNSRLAAVAWPGDAALPKLIIEGCRLQPEIVDPEPVGSWASSDLGGPLPHDLESLLSNEPGGNVVLVSVVPELTRRLTEVRPDLIVADHRLDLPFASDVAALSLVGADRLCNMAAAAAAGLTEALVVDAGTATTFDVLRAGRFVGGMIAPGMESAAKSLGRHGAQLESLPLAPHDWSVGTDTESAQGAGTWHAGRGGIVAVIAGLRKKYGPMPIILTGGLAGHLEVPGACHDPYWTWRGAAFLGLS